MALGVRGIAIGCWTSPAAVSGCTVVLPPAGTVGALAVGGSAPGTREAAALSPRGKVDTCHAVVLSGGSAYGLAAADGVMSWLEARGVGYPVRDAVVPIVGAAIVLDGAVFAADQRPDAAAGHAACDAAVLADPAEGRVGAGSGCSVAKVAGLAHARPGGQGIAVRQAAGVTVGAIVVNNAVGEIVANDGTLLVAADVPAGTPRYPAADMASFDAPDRLDAASNTAIGCIVTDAVLTKAEAFRVAELAHAGIDRAVRPAHTQFDGDALFCLATGTVHGNVDLVADLARAAVAAAARRGPVASGTPTSGGPAGDRAARSAP
ncbi:MAG: P1 family peptidase [Nitriliruptoraceae bacterium]